MIDHGTAAVGWALALLLPALVAIAIVVLAPRLDRWRWLERAEAALADRIVHWHRPRTLALFGDVSALGSSTLIMLFGALTAVAFWHHGATDAALNAALAPAIAGPLGSVLKRLTGRVRPNQPAGAYFGSSLPSNHTLMATALYGTSALELHAQLAAGEPLRGPVISVAFGVVAAVGVSRVLLRVHHPSDVVAAWLLGGAIVAALALRPALG